MIRQPIVLDTHSWIWWVSQVQLLSGAASRVLRGVSEEQPVFVSSISVWELFMLVQKGRLKLRMDPAHWVRQCELSSKIKFVPVDNEIARISVQLPGSPPEDPADRLIIATAVSLGALLVTRDRKIQASHSVKTIW